MSFEPYRMILYSLSAGTRAAHYSFQLAIEPFHFLSSLLDEAFMPQHSLFTLPVIGYYLAALLILATYDATMPLHNPFGYHAICSLAIPNATIRCGNYSDRVVVLFHTLRHHALSQSSSAGNHCLATMHHR